MMMPRFLALALFVAVLGQCAAAPSAKPITRPILNPKLRQRDLLDNEALGLPRGDDKFDLPFDNDNLGIPRFDSKPKKNGF
ncbi:hypothetical protein SDRG_09511 [Saprolegnia diclina VS20]|uniref:Uncharacterized protein n=1 Tax=Saprolegnia diclina (strain VS20) TaxID=1156394 RepID=T0Q596_SAPDV|nr:hypothetical protein SDRG_09511 [Saprolegnia diclina VS20]EQC32989.1 hypothetical protein SDRG_09511 [Saprolegnia diclina VS20]|eukprot:XP_008613675.1 hypothetical protein SDRG_09511 [Saprolegnia diclina VS20]